MNFTRARDLAAIQPHIEVIDADNLVVTITNKLSPKDVLRVTKTDAINLAHRLLAMYADA